MLGSLKFVLISASLGLLFCMSCAMDLSMQAFAVQAYKDWFPEHPSIHFQDALYNHLLINHLRDSAQSLRAVEVGRNERESYFVVPLHVRRKHSYYGMPYHNKKNYFAAFRRPLGADVATFDGIGAINGLKQKDVGTRFANTIRTYTPEELGTVLKMPEEVPRPFTVSGPGPYI